jgi:hypothetical protein
MIAIRAADLISELRKESVDGGVVDGLGEAVSNVDGEGWATGQQLW